MPSPLNDGVMGLHEPDVPRILLGHARRPMLGAEVEAMHAAFTERMIGSAAVSGHATDENATNPNTSTANPTPAAQNPAHTPKPTR